jgi:hypothetical protein
VLQAGVSLSAQSSRSEPLAELAPTALSGWPAYSPAALTPRTSCAFYTMIYLIFRKNQIKSIIEIGLAGVREAYFRR